MQHRHQGRSTDLGLRLSGAALCGVTWLAIRTLFHMRMAPWPASPGTLAYALAVIGFVCGSAGAALLTLGRHIFDEVEIGERWRTRTIVKQSVEPPSSGSVDTRLYQALPPQSADNAPTFIALRRYG
jgi:hypothetical protein